MTGEDRISVLCRKSRAHCSRSVAISAHVRLRPRLINHSPLQTRELVGGVKVGGGGIGNKVPLEEAASCWDIWTSKNTEAFPESGISVL